MLEGRIKGTVVVRAPLERSKNRDDLSDLSGFLKTKTRLDEITINGEPAIDLLGNVVKPEHIRVGLGYWCGVPYKLPSD